MNLVKDNHDTLGNLVDKSPNVKGFYQSDNGQLPWCLDPTIEDLNSSMMLHVIDSNTTYNILLG